MLIRHLLGSHYEMNITELAAEIHKIIQKNSG